ncbi:heavy-metal-associated domain-containing protein [Phenylobacterium sp. 58.2.17]|uniref:heavy-metal-associated domain-containing protein n=1 Tax=Phenylobacterium sp. 58.2.17 TaxID=2969306 RepID=UPI0022652786|nr:heavy-metal-associated domain-containing protein [Phenylobacterium sp. 58.2.17]MCX7587261.1 heavy-metal-associated domain-containing protein [Phenylobacterium sp. 58.2.17]
MLTLTVPDMTCGHCADVVTRAVRSVDSSATLDINLTAQTVSIETAADLAQVTQALDLAGYTALAI